MVSSLILENVLTRPEDAQTPQIPPMNILVMYNELVMDKVFSTPYPKSDRTAKNESKVRQKDVPICKATMQTLSKASALFMPLSRSTYRLAIRGHLRPYRSDAIPSVRAPTDRKSKVNVIEVVIRWVFAELVSPKNCSDKRFMVSETQNYG